MILWFFFQESVYMSSIVGRIQEREVIWERFIFFFDSGERKELRMQFGGGFWYVRIVFNFLYFKKMEGRLLFMLVFFFFVIIRKLLCYGISYCFVSI